MHAYSAPNLAYAFLAAASCSAVGYAGFWSAGAGTAPTFTETIASAKTLGTMVRMGTLRKKREEE